ncbi:unnamed protein product [Ixodes persulcatus]
MLLVPALLDVGNASGVSANMTSAALFLSHRETNATMVPFVETAGCICSSWLPTNHVYFHIANVCLLLSYLTPKGPYGLLYLRAVIGAGSFFFAVWATVVLCAFDTFLWNSLFTLINLVHGLVLVYALRPVSLPGELGAVFEVLFQPLGVTRRQFQIIATRVERTQELCPGQKLAVEKVTQNDRLSLVFSGSLLVSESRRPAQVVGKYEFLEPSEWFEAPESYQYHATATAMAACKVFEWKREPLRKAVSKDVYLKAALENILAKDMARKLHTTKSLTITQRLFRHDDVPVHLPEWMEKAQSPASAGTL